jgi:hypothetical protein
VNMKRIVGGLTTLSLLFVGLACTRYFEMPTSPTPTPSDPSKFESQLVKGGFASRSFAMTEAGTIEVTLTALVPSVVVGLGVGVPDADGSACNLNRSVETTAGSSPQVTAAADAGNYCVKIFDIGQVEGSASFSITLTHP